jgi:hypothetical protein
MLIRNNLHKSKTILVHSTLLNTITRSMRTSRGLLGQQATNLVKRHSYPPMSVRTYKGVVYKNPNNLRTETNKPLSQHETTHAMVVSDDGKTSYGVLTSAKKPKPGFIPHVIDKVNYKGETKDQSVASFSYPREILPEMLIEDPKITQYIKNKEKVLDQIFKDVKKIKAIKIINKDYFDTPKDEEIFTK